MLASAGGSVLDPDDPSKVTLTDTPEHRAATVRALNVLKAVATARAPIRHCPITPRTLALGHGAGQATFELNWPYVYSSMRSNAATGTDENQQVPFFPEMRQFAGLFAEDAPTPNAVELAKANRVLAKRFAYAPYPGVEAALPARSTLGGLNLAVSSRSHKADRAWRAVRCLTSVDAQRQYALKASMAPTAKAFLRRAGASLGFRWPICCACSSATSTPRRARRRRSTRRCRRCSRRSCTPSGRGTRRSSLTNSPRPRARRSTVKGWSRERRRGRSSPRLPPHHPGRAADGAGHRVPDRLLGGLSLNRVSLTEPGRTGIRRPGQLRSGPVRRLLVERTGVTLLITVVSVAIELVLGMAIALVMHRTIVGRGTVRTMVLLLPYGVVTVVAAMSWYYAWTPDTGYLANLLPDGSAPLTHQLPSLAIIVLAEVWKTTPFMALLLLAGLALVPDDLLRAAQVDGAGRGPGCGGSSFR